MPSGSIAPGADDNASGTAAVLKQQEYLHNMFQNIQLFMPFGMKKNRDYLEANIMHSRLLMREILL